MKKDFKSEYLDRLKTVYLCADEICKKNKKIDRDIVVQSLLMAYHSPLENLNFSLMRAKNFRSSQ
jgi:hypothetical protein